MRRSVLSFVLFFAAAGAMTAAAEPVPPPQPTEAAPPLEFEEDERTPPPELVFISPAGEPFRAPLGSRYPSADWFTRADADHDGNLTAAEFTADAVAFLNSLDKDRDGLVDGFENADYEQDIAPEIRGVLRRPPPAQRGPLDEWRPVTRGDMMWGRLPLLSSRRGRQDGPPRRQGAAQYGLLNEPHPVRGADGDLDGKISRPEIEAAARRRFGLLDVDGDGKVSLQDLPGTPAQILYGDAEPPERRIP